MGRMHRRFEHVPAGLSQKLCWSLHWLHSTKSCCCTLGSLWHFIKQSFYVIKVPCFDKSKCPEGQAVQSLITVKLGLTWGATEIHALSHHLLSVFSGIGYATQIVIAYAAVSYIVIQAWAFFYLFSSFTAEVPWASCRNSWNTGAQVFESAEQRSSKTFESYPHNFGWIEFNIILVIGLLTD